MKSEKTVSDYPLSILRVSISGVTAMGVQTSAPGRLRPPEFLYQVLPADAMALPATLPRGHFAVSIPHPGDFDSGYPILKSPPPVFDGFVIVYCRQPNNRYEAIEIRFRDENFEIMEFHETARRWVEAHEGHLNAVSGRHSYFAPTRDFWGVVLRDEGYAALNPLKFSFDLAPELHETLKKPESSGVIARIPVYAGEKSPAGAVAPVFAQVEVMLDAPAGLKRHWISFAEYQKMRAIRSRPPAPVVAGFKRWRDQLAQDCGFERWVFRQGMRFADRMEWWGNGNRRRTVHEGLDFAEGVQPGGEVREIPELAPVRALADGDVTAILDDFLGKTIVVRHNGILNEHGDAFYTFLSHLRPEVQGLGPVAKGRILGRVGESPTSGAPAHIHLTGAWIPRVFQAHEIRLDHIHPAFAPVVLVDFNGLI
jgi:hypothetical protein